MLQIRKTLTANDLGVTGGHQAGIVIPKSPEILSFFPFLDSEVQNPRATISVVERESGEPWEFNYIYYNGRLHNTSTRNEYRLTKMTSFLRNLAAEVGDDLVFEREHETDPITVWLSRANAQNQDDSKSFTIKLTGNWKVITIR